MFIDSLPITTMSSITIKEIINNWSNNNIHVAISWRLWRIFFNSIQEVIKTIWRNKDKSNWTRIYKANGSNYKTFGNKIYDFKIGSNFSAVDYNTSFTGVCESNQIHVSLEWYANTCLLFRESHVPCTWIQKATSLVQL